MKNKKDKTVPNLLYENTCQQDVDSKLIFMHPVYIWGNYTNNKITRKSGIYISEQIKNNFYPRKYINCSNKFIYTSGLLEIFLYVCCTKYIS